MAFGYGFQPGADQGANRQPLERRQEAIKLLSLRLPKRFGPRAITAPELASGPGGMGAPGARPGATAQAFAMLAGVPLAPVAAPSWPSASQDGAFTIPTAQQDREQGVFRALPQPAPRDPASAIRDLAPAYVSPVHVTLGQETGEGPPQRGSDDFIRGTVDQPQPFSDPYEELRFLLGLGRDDYNLR